MKVAKTFAVFALCGFSALMGGCSKQEGAPAAQTQNPTDQAATEIQKQAEAPKASVQPAVGEAAAGASSQAQSLIDKAKGLIENKQYPEAMNILKELSNTKLTPEQQKLVDDLKVQVEKAMAGAATSEATKSATDAVGGVLGK